MPFLKKMGQNHGEDDGAILLTPSLTRQELEVFVVDLAAVRHLHRVASRKELMHPGLLHVYVLGH